MNIGYYVRTEKGIAKIIGRVNDPTNYFDKFWICDKYLELNDDTEYIHKQDVIKSSLKLSNVLEDGDIAIVINEKGEREYHRYVDSNEPNIEVGLESNPRLAGVITKEQIEHMMYKVN